MPRWYGRNMYPRGTAGYSRFGRTGERKFADAQLQDTTVSANGYVDDAFTDIAQGTTESQRIGRCIWVTSLHWKGMMRIVPQDSDAVTSPVNHRLRFMVLLDKQANGALPSVTDVIESAGVDQFRNLANSHRFKMLYDQNITLPAQSIEDNANPANYNALAVRKNVSGNLVFKYPIKIDFTSTSGATTEKTQNNIVAIFISEVGEATYIDVHFRLR